MTAKTISQALRRIKEIKGRLAKTTARARGSVSWVEPNKPVYNYINVMSEYKTLTDELITLKTRLAKTNAVTPVTLPDGPTVSIQQAVFTMAELKALKELYTALPIQEGSFKEISEYTRNGDPVYETKQHCSAVSEVERDKLVSTIEETISAINAVIEDANHKTALSD